MPSPGRFGGDVTRLDVGIVDGQVPSDILARALREKKVCRQRPFWRVGIPLLPRSLLLADIPADDTDGSASTGDAAPSTGRGGEAERIGDGEGVADGAGAAAEHDVGVRKVGVDELANGRLEGGETGDDLALFSMCFGERCARLFDLCLLADLSGMMGIREGHYAKACG